jgi:hypothetical protein
VKVRLAAGVISQVASWSRPSRSACALDQALPESRSELEGESQGESVCQLTDHETTPKPADVNTFGSIAQSVELRTFNP